LRRSGDELDTLRQMASRVSRVPTGFSPKLLVIWRLMWAVTCGNDEY
jgi:hypothetical protein